VKLVDLVGLHIESTSGAPLVLLREHEAPFRVVPIFVGAPEAVAIAAGMNGDVPGRPMTHDVMAGLIETLDAHVVAVEVTGLRNGAFLAELAVDGPHGARRVDSRPSDAIALAVRTGAPLFVADAVLEAAGSLILESTDEESILLVESSALDSGEWGGDGAAYDDQGFGDEADGYGIYDADDPGDDGPDGDGPGGWFDEARIDEAVAELRAELDVLDPADFVVSEAESEPGPDDGDPTDEDSDD
jgi:bifunctional DNase/RNase